MDLFKSGFKKNDFDAEADAKLSENLRFLEDVLAEEDPDFVKSLNELTEINLNLTDTDHASILDQAIQKIEVPNDSNAFQKIFYWARQPFLFYQQPKKVLYFWFFVLVIGAATVVMVKSNIWTTKSKLFISSYADWGIEVLDYDMLTEAESFFDNTRFSKNVMSLIKMTANLRPSENSSDNPMLSFEIVIEGISNGPIVEIKDREAEFRDLVLRATEEFSYDELENAEGKQRLSDTILAKMNTKLSDGQIRKVYYKNFVIKP